MSYIEINTGLTSLNDKITGFAARGMQGASMHLYTNNHTPVHADTLASFTEAVFAGYSAQTMTWPNGSVLVGSQAQALGSFNNFNNTSGVSQNVYGYYVTDSAGVLLGGEIFTGAPISIPNGFSLGVQLTYTHQSQF